ncbi:Bug family tripartite tricarboxylate transporter substrate binding protein [Pigmentiphaga litoralis]|uniref:Tripartite-type tricarboxylate transporter receptor subunit TctC n=1 Tax=Pigmentiphaga litoralis TaxID=516702 RepID=A0A7Y9IWR2_9BURK|nr:tripartite tricarboxylate transporter substrate binding protein [Pigmentiphaga litoralis]NYE21914.1 tripartite-type tricarboxylate transporter receptor subunit TctC [Pigmentiphaga litoralis]NYE84471.1 tripartite-type tricarboxylate transporter receptor subunit TctC [Pigmentiphaga litoralis]
MKTPFRRRCFQALVAASVLSTLAPVYAQDSDRPLRFIVPLSPGSTGDMVGRTLGQALNKTMNRPVVVENIPGAGGMLGTAQMVRAAKDGSTLALVTSTHVINPNIYKNMSFDTIKDVTPISIIGGSPGILLVNPKLPVHNLKELIAYAKANPGQLNYGSSGNGTSLHLLAVMLAQEAKIEMMHVPYKGNAPLLADLIGGQVQLAFQSTAAAAPLVKAGTLRPIGISTTSRSRILPDVPTLAEQGLTNFNLGSWMAILGPAGMPADVVQRENRQVLEALALPEVKEWFAAQDFELVGNSPADASKYLQSELVKHTKLVQESGAKLQ